MRRPFHLDVQPFADPVSRRVDVAAPQAAGAAGEASVAREALSVLLKAIRLDPGDADYHYILGGALSDLGRHEEACTAFRDAVRLHRNDPTYHVALGGALWRVGRLEEARAAFEDGVAVAPDDVRALSGFGVVLLGLGEMAQAATVLGRVAERQPASAEARSNWAVALWGAGDQDGALRAFQEASRLRPDSAPLLRNLGMGLLARGRHEQALDCFRKVASLRPGDADVHLDIGDALYELGRHAEAEASYDEAAHIDPRAMASRPQSQEARQAIIVRRARAEVRVAPRPLQWFFSLVLGTAWTTGRVLHTALRIPLLGGRWGIVPITFALAAAGSTGWAVLPPYVAYYQLRDRVTEIARAPVEDDAEILQRLIHAVHERGMQRVLGPEDFHVETRPRWRTIACAYSVPVHPLPGLEWRLHFEMHIEEPYLSEPPPKFL
jgi:Flp pilus assembly protein TadD